MTTTTAGILSELDNGILRLTFNRPERMNAIDLETMNALADAIVCADNNPDVRTIVITGTGRAFCTGADLATAAMNPADPHVVMDSANAVIRAITSTAVPVIAAVNGPAAGVGVSIALAADLTYAAESAYFLLSFVNIGLMPDGGASALVPAAIGRARAAEMFLLGERVSADDAERFGLVSRTLPNDQFAAHIEAVAARTSKAPRRALELTKAALNAATLDRIDSALELEKSGQVELLASADFAEGATAMLQKRAPNFK
ncbi:enoyl-CoA hydratase [Rhodococcus sp. IEGM 1379]|uniref:enoyl-CoA hydratase n=1 Tax=Rhodococcus sp. IEGM 1379 TaxID=3047086 RepID=UPI0024B7E030|nr:enoyl-CoA hydratase [Rhodococcus sp. IEGM 1379]MDI9917513.1 enoyl-CoA hydratase [Rhodococcus sp. IEGM 1379]